MTDTPAEGAMLLKLRNAITIAMDEHDVPAGVQALVLKALRQVEARYAQGAASSTRAYLSAAIAKASGGVL
jgi:hypothetical protein